MSIKIQVNGKDEEIPEKMCLLEFLNKKKIKQDIVVVELNDQIIEKEQYSQTFLNQGDIVELVFYMGGGYL
jgi:sulfur carrier protein